MKGASDFTELLLDGTRTLRTLTLVSGRGCFELQIFNIVGIEFDLARGGNMYFP